MLFDALQMERYTLLTNWNHGRIFSDVHSLTVILNIPLNPDKRKVQIMQSGVSRGLVLRTAVC